MYDWASEIGALMKSAVFHFRLVRLFMLIAGITSLRTVEAMDINVTNNNDAGAGSLRQALLDNETLGGGNTVTFSNTVTGTITLLSGELGITNSVSIVGPGSGMLTVSGDNASRVFRIQGGNVSISDLTIANGAVVGGSGMPQLPGLSVRGGGIFVRSNASLELTHCVIVNNTITGGVGGPVLTDPGTAGNGGNGFGGGIGNAGILTMTECTVSGNSASGGQGGYADSFGTPGAGGLGWGGGLYSVGPATLTRCTVSSNNVFAGPGYGTAAPGVGYGGGVYNASTLTLLTCTVANNLATSTSADEGGGIYDAGTGLTNRNCTIASNHATTAGGLLSAGTAADLGGTILANNATSYASDCSGSIISSDYNLIRDTTGCTISGSTAHNVIGQQPMLGPLRDNGGPTFTKALFPGSPAINQGTSFGTTTDQRGAPRPFEFPLVPNVGSGDGSDIGAYELGNPQLSIQSSGTNAVVSWPAYYGGFTLESNSDLSSTTWNYVPGSPSVINNQYWQTNPISGTMTFYRLVQ